MNTQSQEPLTPIERYNHFLRAIVQTGKIWTLIDSNGNFALFEADNDVLFSLWPDEASIESNLSVDWQDYIPFKFDLAALEETVLPLIRKNGYAINISPSDSRTGYIVSVNHFVNDLKH